MVNSKKTKLICVDLEVYRILNKIASKRSVEEDKRISFNTILKSILLKDAEKI